MTGGWEITSDQQFGPPPSANIFTPTTRPASTENYLSAFIFHEFLDAIRWKDASWGCTRNFASPASGAGGTTALTVAITSSYGYFALKLQSGATLVPRSGRVQFFIHVDSPSVLSTLSLVLNGPAPATNLEQGLGGRINVYRCMHGAPALTWHVGLAQSAATYASSCLIKPSGVSGYGESIGTGPVSCARFPPSGRYPCRLAPNLLPTFTRCPHPPRAPPLLCL